MVTRNRDARKKQFQAALKLAGLTQQQWAEKQGVTLTHLSYYLNGVRQSGPLDKAVAEFIDEQRPKMAAIAA